MAHDSSFKYLYEMQGEVFSAHLFPTHCTSLLHFLLCQTKPVFLEGPSSRSIFAKDFIEAKTEILFDSTCLIGTRAVLRSQINRFTMVFLKEFHEGQCDYLSIVDREGDNVDAGTCLVTRLSLRTPSGGSSVVSKANFLNEMSLKLDLTQLDTSARYVLESTLRGDRDGHHTFRLLREDIVSGKKT